MTEGEGPAVTQGRGFAMTDGCLSPGGRRIYFAWLWPNWCEHTDKPGDCFVATLLAM